MFESFGGNAQNAPPQSEKFQHAASRRFRGASLAQKTQDAIGSPIPARQLIISQLQPVTIVRFNILGWQREVSTCRKPICCVDDVDERRRDKPESVRLRAVTFWLPDVTKRLPSSLLSPALI
jgi:hypothetical protein